MTEVWERMLKKKEDKKKKKREGWEDTTNKMIKTIKATISIE